MVWEFCIDSTWGKELMSQMKHFIIFIACKLLIKTKLFKIKNA
jgi:hypothetical protein